ncbi:MAG TPA: hypothetical protein VFT64_08760 [Rickettsiales bacterium]|nr:hypothetical protein [Rickettsiales bacterium]
MRKFVAIMIVTALSFSLAGCFVLAVGAAGAGGGYIYKDQQDKGKVP